MEQVVVHLVNTHAVPHLGVEPSQVMKSCRDYLSLPLSASPPLFNVLLPYQIKTNSS